MILNFVEKAAMNNPVRAFVQRHFEAKRLLSMGGAMPGGTALEVGCGRGVGSELMLNVFGADNVDAFDLDPHMVRLAQKRLERYGDRIRLRVGDVTDIPAEDNYYDAVFDFGIVHHVPNWRDALKEIHRVLIPGGRFYSEEILVKFISNPVWRRLLDHPEEDRFNQDKFLKGLEDCGFVVVASTHIFHQFGWFIADKPESTQQEPIS
jgi:ubiquinone/menaquinone biosynthesis C-methylase UbiE